VQPYSKQGLRVPKIGPEIQKSNFGAVAFNYLIQIRDNFSFGTLKNDFAALIYVQITILLSMPVPLKTACQTVAIFF
jgi:hypothetical protein